MNSSVNAVNENWHQPVSLFLPELVSCEEEETFFDTGELLSGVTQSSAAAVSGIGAPITTAVTTAPSPLSGANDASLSPSGGSTTTTTGGVTSGPLSPGAISQTSNNAGSGSGNGSVPTAAAVALGIAEADAAAIGGGGVGSVLGAVGDGGGGGTSCCENGRPIMTDPVSGQTVCSCQYDSARLALSSYSRMPAASVGVYGTPYPSTEQNPYPSIGVDSSAFYSPLSNPYALKEGNTGSDMTAWTSAGLQPTTGYYSYDPALAAYGYGAGYDLASRRKNATRESTATLKAWLNEHKKNPYPTKGEKIMLAIITKMTLTQVSTWFANARRRLKKENKMTWEPKNKTEDDDEAMLSDDEKDKDASEPEKVGGAGGVYGGIGADPRKDVQSVKTEHGAGKEDKPDDLNGDERKPENLAAMRGLAGPTYNAAYGQHPGYNPYQQHHPAYYQQHGGYGAQEPSEYSAPKNPLSRGDCGIPIPASKPKIWSLADTVACKTPPPPIAYQQGPAPGQYYHPAPPPQQQQQQQMLSSSNMGGTQQMQLPQLQPQPHPAHNSSASAMSSYGAASPYSRIPMGYTAGPSNYSSSSSNSNCGSNGSSSSNSGMPTTPTTPPTMQAQQLLHQQQQQQLLQAHHYHQQQQQQQQQRMGFPEIQPDTPPQTPPNMKLASAHSSSTVNPLRAGPALTPTTAMCYTNGAGSHLQPHAAYGGDGACNRFVANLAAARAEA